MPHLNQEALKNKDIDINQFDYLLNEERIAKYPLSERDASNLLIYRKGKDIKHCQFSQISQEIPSGSLVLYNNTKVIHARITFRKETGARIEIFCLSPVDPIDYQLTFASRNRCIWSCMVGNLKKWKEGSLIHAIAIEDKEVILKATFIDKDSKGNPIIEFEWNSEGTFAEVLKAVGQIPIPPYLNRDTEEIDSHRYQTVYSKHNGSVAAPTAGLHFTDKVFEQLKKNNVGFAEVTLHVGAGTFQPVKAKNALDHEMHGEQIIVSKELLNQLLSHKNRIIATGTTTMRTLESIYWLGVKASNGEGLNRLDQWYWRESDSQISVKDSFQALLNYLVRCEINFLVSTTEIMIVPGYDFRVVDGIITNFHQPKSTLLLLISAFIGDHWKAVYDYALRNDFRFLSYGDSSLLWRM